MGPSMFPCRADRLAGRKLSGKCAGSVLPERMSDTATGTERGADREQHEHAIAGVDLGKTAVNRISDDLAWTANTQEKRLKPPRSAMIVGMAVATVRLSTAAISVPMTQGGDDEQPPCRYLWGAQDAGRHGGVGPGGRWLAAQ